MVFRALLSAGALIALTMLGQPVLAQQEGDMMEVIRAQVAANRQALVAANMGLTAEESEAFWPVYRNFQAKRAELDARELRLLTEFRDSYLDLSDEQARSILDEYLKNAREFQKLRKQYAREFGKILPDKKVLRFMQIDSKIDTIIDFELVQVVPLAE